jgi:hypothetical protein
MSREFFRVAMKDRQKLLIYIITYIFSDKYIIAVSLIQHICYKLICSLFLPFLMVSHQEFRVLLQKAQAFYTHCSG